MPSEKREKSRRRLQQQPLHLHLPQGESRHPLHRLPPEVVTREEAEAELTEAEAKVEEEVETTKEEVADVSRKTNWLCR